MYQKINLNSNKENAEKDLISVLVKKKSISKGYNKADKVDIDKRFILIP